MRRALPWIGLLLAGVLALGGIGAVVVAAGAKSNGDAALDSALRLYSARLQVSEAQRRLGESDLDDALASARDANAAAERVGAITARLVRLLETTQPVADAIQDASDRGARTVSFTRRQTDAVTSILGAIAGYQRSASTDAARTNRALRRILEALRETNESLPGGSR